MTASAARPSRRPLVALLVLAALALYYLFLLSNGTFTLFAPEAFDRVYGSMLRHLLQGDFTVDRSAIGSEAFVRDGRTYAYFGVLPALLRLPELWFGGVDPVHVARLSCLVAVVLFVALQLQALRWVELGLPAAARRRWLHAVMVVAIVLSGPQLYLLASSSIYHEAVFWAAALAAAFNLVIVRAVYAGRALSLADLCLLALLAGCALHARPSIGLSLSVGATLLALWSALAGTAAGAGGGPLRRLPALAVDARLLLPLLILAAFALLVGWVNYERWGNALKFADFRYYEFAHRQPHRLEVIMNYGEVNPSRIWISSLYYATGIPYVLKSVSPFAEMLRARFDGLEAPPITPLLTNPLTVLFAGYGLWRLLRRPDEAAGGAALLRITLLGHAVAVLVLLSAMYLALRYRFDFAPFMTLAAFVGYRALCLRLPQWQPQRQRRAGAALVVLCLVGVLMSHYVLVIYKVTSTTVPEPVRRALLPLAPFAHAALEK